MLVLGIDPGTVRMGYGVLTVGESVEVDDYGVIGLPDRMPWSRDCTSFTPTS